MTIESGYLKNKTIQPEHGTIIRTIILILVPCPEMFCKKKCSQKFCKIHRTTSLAHLLKKVSCRRFPVKFAKFLRTPFFIEHWWLHLKKQETPSKHSKIKFEKVNSGKVEDFQSWMYYFRVIFQRFSRNFGKHHFSEHLTGKQPFVQNEQYKPLTNV